MSQRLQYLRALGIDVWERRDNPSLSATPATNEVSITEAATLRARSELPPAKPSRMSVTGEAAIQATHEAASFDWTQLESAVSACTRCDLHRTRTQTVFGVGNRRAEVMVIGEAPGADEDAQGEPFVGRAGQLLNSMLKAMGYPRETVFIANVLKSRPPNNRDPAPAEVLACIPFLHRQIELVNPKLILCVGRIAAQNLLNTDTPIGKLRGQVHRLGVAQRPVIVTYHPAYLLRSPGEKRRSWQDLILALDTLRNL